MIWLPSQDKHHFRERGAVFILSVCILSLLLLSLAGILSLSSSRREVTRKGLNRDFAELDARTLLLNLKSALVSQITQTGGFNLGQWPPASDGMLMSGPSGASSVPFQRSIRWTGTATGSVHPDLGGNGTPASELSPLQGLLCRRVADCGIVGRWEPEVTGNGHARAETAWQIAASLSISQVPISAFTYYSSSRQTLVSSSLDNLGRVHAEGDLTVSVPADALAPVTCAGGLFSKTGGVLMVTRGTPQETRAFGSASTPEDYQVQGRGWIFERDSNPVLMVRPASTAELFSKNPLPLLEKENQRLKPRCDLRIFHGVDAAGEDVFTFDGGGGFAIPAGLLAALHRDGGTLQIDFSKWPTSGSWPTKIWIETNQSEISAILVKNAEGLRGDLSLATGLNIEISGSFNTSQPVRKASLMTLGRVVSVP